MSAGDVAVLGGVSSGLSVSGVFVKRWAVDHGPWITGHVHGEMGFQRWLGGECKTGERNFLDNDFGSMIAPAAAMAAITAIDLGYPRGSEGKEVAQDLFVFGAGLAATKGITDILKGIVARERPVYSILGDEAAKEYDAAFLRHSFPSGHTSGAFFSAAFLNLRAQETMRREMSGDDYRSWRWVSSLVTYGWASAVGLSRVHAYKHHLSDVIVGAALGVAVAELMYGVAERSSGDGGDNAPVLLRISFAL